MVIMLIFYVLMLRVRDARKKTPQRYKKTTICTLLKLLKNIN